MENIFLQIKAEMEKQRISEGKLAELTGIPQSTIHRIINRKTKKIDLEKLVPIQQTLGLVSESLEMYAVTTIHSVITPEEQEILNILKSNPNMDVTIRGMAQMPEDVQKQINDILLRNLVKLPRKG